jgi:hypothetical protein
MLRRAKLCCVDRDRFGLGRDNHIGAVKCVIEKNQRSILRYALL